MPGEIKVLITGGAGFIGSHLCVSLLKRNISVILTDSFRSAKNTNRKYKNIAKIKHNSKLSIIDTDIKNIDVFKCIFRHGDIPYMVHFAGKASVADSFIHPVENAKVNLIAATSLFELAFHSHVKHIVYASSSLVYGRTDILPMNENDPCRYPTSPYSVILKALECMTHALFYKYHIPITGLRLFPVYGPRMRDNLLIPVIVRSIISGKPVEVYGDGSAARSYTYIDDIIEGIITCIFQPNGDQLINLGSPHPTTIRTLINIIEVLLHKKATILIKSKRNDDVPLLYPDLMKAKKLLHYSTKISLEEGLKRYVDWYLTVYGKTK